MADGLLHLLLNAMSLHLLHVILYIVPAGDHVVHKSFRTHI